MSLDEVSALIEARLPALASAHLSLLDQGWDNVVFEATFDAPDAASWVVRLPRRAVALPLLYREVRVLQWLKGLAFTPLPVPNPSAVADTPTGAEEISRYPWAFWAAPKLGGRELADLADGMSNRRELAVAMGDFLAWLHAQRPPFPLPFDPNARCDTRTRVGFLVRAVDELSGHGISVPKGLPDLIAQAIALPHESAHERANRTSRSGVVLSHGDLHLRHVLVDDFGNPTGVIDWGDVCLADPLLDLSFGYAAFEPTDRLAFFSAYGQRLSAEDDTRARVLAANLSALLALSALDSGSPRVGEYLQGLCRSLA